MASKAPCVEVRVITTKGQGEADVVSSPNEPWHVPALNTCGQCKMKGPDWSEDCSCPITLRVDFVATRIVGSNADK